MHDTLTKRRRFYTTIIDFTKSPPTLTGESLITLATIVTPPTQNTMHVTFMYHAIIIDLYALHNMHVAMLMYMNV